MAAAVVVVDGVISMSAWRLLDTGTRSAAENIALDDILFERRVNGQSESILRFMKFSPSTVLIGHHQVVEQEARVDWCELNGIELNRRLTGGGAIYFDETQIGWELIGSIAELGCRDMTDLTKRICDAAARGLRRLGIAAEFRPRNDIEVEGKKISGTGGVADGDIFLYQGTILVDFDIESMLMALKIPREKLTPRGLETARDRVTCLGDLLKQIPSESVIKRALVEAFSESFSANFVADELNQSELKLLPEKIKEYQSDDWLNMITRPDDEKQIYTSVHKTSGGMLRVHASVDVRRSWLRQILITGDFFINPKRAILDLEATLMNTQFPNVRPTILNFFKERKIDLVGLTPEDFCDAVKLALEQTTYHRLGIDDGDASAVYPVNLPPETSIEQVMADATVLLLPYCAKLPDCEYRFTQGCDECGLCTIGDAYKLAKERGLEAVTIVKFEHLKETLSEMKEQGVKSWIGCACEAFFIKRNEAFRDAGMPGVVLDIVGKTCYDLGQEKQAYSGTFEARADLKLPLLEAVVNQVESHSPIQFIPPSTPPADQNQHRKRVR